MGDLPQINETTFAETAIKLGLAKLEQIEECYRLQERISRAGLKPKPLVQLMLAKGYITREQLDQIARAERAASTQRQDGAAPKVEEVPVQIAGFKILSKIGEGAVGAVYKANQLSMDRIVAIKVLSPRYAGQQKMRLKFLSEARMAAKLSHTNIVQAIDVGQDGDINYFVMEYIDGPTVGRLLKRGGALEEKRCIQIILEAAQALSYAHRHGILHRDVKPDNLMITREGVVKLCDLGLARPVHDPEQIKAGIIVGTPYYMSPEQARGTPDIDHRSDIYSLGATFYHMISGQVPFSGDNAVAVVTKHLTEPLIPPRQRAPQISAESDYVITRMMMKDRAERYQKMEEVIEDLQAIRNGEPPGGFVAPIRRLKARPRGVLLRRRRLRR